MISSVSDVSPTADFYVNGVPISGQQHAALSLLEGAIEVSEHAQAAALASTPMVDPTARVGTNIDIMV